MRAMTPGAALLSCTLAFLPCGRAIAEATRAPRSTAPAQARLSLEAVAVMLASADDDEVRTALEAAALRPSREVVPLVEERVRAGLPPVLLEVALDTLLLLHDPSTGRLLADLARHRRPAIRVRAIEALAQLKGPQAEPALVRALGDAEPEVRKAAAVGLGSLAARGSFAPLRRAFERGVEGAAHALGQVANSSDVTQLLELLADASPEALMPAFTALFARREIAETEKLRVVEKLATLGTEEAQSALATLSEGLPREASQALRRALAQSVQKGLDT